MKMRQVAFISFLFCLFMLGCTLATEEVPLSDPAEHNMKFIPDNPTSANEVKLVVYDDCTYNTLSGVSRKGTTIDIRKQFNSMMKLPCFPKNDTISLGQLPQGTYTVKYKLVDLSTQVKDSIALTLAFQLIVAE